MTSNSPAHILLEGFIKHRDSRKWKSRWAVVSKLSPVADCLHINLYSSYNDKTRNALPKRVILLESLNYLGIESGFTLQNESSTLAILCKDNTVVIALETREIMHQWQTKLQDQFFKEHHFLVHIVSLPPKSHLTCGPARMLLSASCFCLVSGIPPRLLGFWQMEHLRRFGALDGKFCFEGGSKCGKGLIGLHGLYTNQAEEINKYFELASCGQLDSVNLQASDSDGYYRKSRESLLYKYANGTSGKEVHKSTSSDSSTCDSCSHVLSFGEEHCRSSYYLNLDGSKCSLYNSSINLNCHEQLSLPTGKVCTVKCHQKHGSICNANLECKCHFAQKGSVFSASTISRLSSVKCDLTKCLSQDCHLASLPSPTDTLKAYSPSTVSLAQCNFIASDRESLFSQSSQGSNSSSGCSSLTCTDHNHSGGIGHHLWSSQVNDGTKAIEPITATMAVLRHDSPRERINPEYDADTSGKECPRVLSKHPDHGRDGFISGHLSAPNGTHCEVLSGGTSAPQPLTARITQKWSHLYSQINFINRSNESSQMANYDIPRNLCVNVALFNQNKESLSASHQQKPTATINHCHCDTVQSNDGNETRDWRALNADSIMHDRGSGCASPDSTLIRRTKHHFLPTHSACVPDNETHHQCNQQEAIKQAHCPPMPHLNGEPYGMVPTCVEQPVSANHKTVPLRAQPNYANMRFINSIELYENLCFDPLRRQSNFANVDLAHSVGGDEFIIGVSSQLRSSQCEEQSPNCAFVCAGNCPSHHTDRQSRCQCSGQNGVDSVSSESGDDLLTDPTNGKADAISNGTDKSMNGCTVCPPSVRPCQAVRREECTGEERASGEGKAHPSQQNGNNSLTGPSTSNTKRANNGAHYHRYHHHLRDGLQDGPKNVNISLSSLHNRTSCKRATRRDCNCACSLLGAKWSISNAISGSQPKHHCFSKSLLRFKSYSIDDIISIGTSLDGNCVSTRPSSSTEWHTSLATTGQKQHQSDEALNAVMTIRPSRPSTWPCHQFWATEKSFENIKISQIE